MIDSDIKRTITIDANRREVSFLMVAPLQFFIDKPEAWNKFGEISRADMMMEDVLRKMSEMVEIAKLK